MTLLKSAFLILSLTIVGGHTNANADPKLRLPKNSKVTKTQTIGLHTMKELKPSFKMILRSQVQTTRMDQALRKNSTPPMLIFPAKAKTTWKQTRVGNYSKRITPTFKVSNLGESGIVDMLMLLPTSGHNGQEKATLWSTQSKYNIRVTHADGSVQNLGQVQSNAFVTEHGMTIKLQKGKSIIQMWPTGSAGVAGFRSGREMEVEWDGK